MLYLMNIIILAVVFIGMIVLQVFLSMAKNKWLGLILPGITLLLSLIVVVGLTSYTAVNSASSWISIGETTFWQAAVQAVVTFLLYNIPTAVLLVIYAAGREGVKRKKNKELERMNIQDL